VLDARITRWHAKLIFVVSVMAGGFVIGRVMTAAGVWPYVASVTNSIILLAGLLLGARIFRGRGEAIEPARPWWQLTARPTLSRRLGIVSAVGAGFALISGVLAAVGVPVFADESRVDSVLVYFDSLVFYGVVAFLYFTSAAHLKGVVTPPREPKFRTKISLK
jgi:hypothetical protein